MRGTPGFYLGIPFIYSFYNDIVNASKIANIIMFADDITLFFKHKEFCVLYTTINVEVAKISQWLKLNKLSLNIKKPTTLLFEIKILQQLTRTLS